MQDDANTLEEFDLPELRQARLLWAQNRWDEAEAAFVRIAEQHPRNLHALVDAARVLGDRQEIRRASQLLERLTALAGNRNDLLLLLGQTWRMSHREERAIQSIEEYVCGKGQRDPAGHLELAVLYERRRRLADADAAASAALKCAPGCAEALIIRARVRRQRGESDSAAAALQRVVRDQHANPNTKAQAWAMLADMADRASDTERAIKHMERCKQLLLPHAQRLLPMAFTALGAWEKVCRGLTRETAERWRAEPRAVGEQASAERGAEPPTPRPVHLLGFPRSGTTLLENILDAHPEIISSEERQVLGRDLLNVLWREPGQFTPPSLEALEAIPAEKLATLRRRYWKRMEEGLGAPIGGRHHIDKNPTHTLFIPGILRLLPDSRFIVALRDPRDVAVSCWFQYLPLNPNSACFLTWQDTVRRYLLDMGAWLALRDVLPADSWLEVRYEELVADLSGQAQRAVAFLGLPWDESVLSYRDRVAEKAVHTPSYLDVNCALYTRAIGRWHRYARWMEPHLAALRPLVEAFGYRWDA